MSSNVQFKAKRKAVAQMTPTRKFAFTLDALF